MEKIDQIEEYIDKCKRFARKKQLSVAEKPTKLEAKTDFEFYIIEENIYSEILEEIKKIKNS